VIEFAWKAFVMAAGKTIPDRDADDEVKIYSAKRSAFWGGVFDGFSGPWLMALELKIPIPGKTKTGGSVMIFGQYIPAAKEYASWSRSQREFGNALARASEKIAARKRLVSKIVREKRLDQNGKMRTVERTLVEHRSAHGKSQERS
jgi:hypothetical protein